VPTLPSRWGPGLLWEGSRSPAQRGAPRGRKEPGGWAPLTACPHTLPRVSRAGSRYRRSGRGRGGGVAMGTGPSGSRYREHRVNRSGCRRRGRAGRRAPAGRTPRGRPRAGRAGGGLRGGCCGGRCPQRASESGGAEVGAPRQGLRCAKRTLLTGKGGLGASAAPGQGGGLGGRWSWAGGVGRRSLQGERSGRILMWN